MVCLTGLPEGKVYCKRRFSRVLTVAVTPPGRMKASFPRSGKGGDLAIDIACRVRMTEVWRR